MWAGELFQAFIEDDTAKEKEMLKYLPPTSKCSLQSIKSVFKKRKKQGMTPFIAAILHHDVVLCEKLIEEGIDFGEQGPVEKFDEEKFMQFTNNVVLLISSNPNSNVFNDFKKTTPMFWAIRCAEIGLIEKLMLSGHKMNFPVEKFTGMLALSFAILCENIHVVRYFLLSQSCDIHEKSFVFMKPLDLAMRLENQDMVRLILEHGEDPNCSNHQLSPLLHAVFLKNLEMAKLMLKMGANINFGEETGNLFTPLNMAILRRHFEIAFFLIEKGADVTVKDSNHDTPLHLLFQHIKIQTKNKFDPTALKLAQLLVDKGAKVNVANKRAQIPLVIAISWQEPELVDLLLSAPVDLNTLLHFKPKVTFLHIAVSPPTMFTSSGLEKFNANDYWEKRINIVQSLINKGADVNKQSEDGRTSLHFAAETGNVKLVQMLLASKVDINKQSENGKAALHFAAYNGSLQVVQLMLESGAEVNVTDNFGSTPLHFGITENELFSCNTAKVFLDYGTDIYSSCVLVDLKIYDILLVMMETDLIKLFWREGYPYDFTMFQPFNSSLDFLHSFFQFSQNNVFSIDFKKRIKEINRKQMEELLSAQSMFIKGVETNDVILVLNALEKGAEAGGSSVKVPFPLHFLAKKGFTDVAHVLLTKSVKPNTVDSKGKIPLDLAVEFGHYSIYITLLQHGGCYNRPGFDTSVLQKQGNNQHHKLYMLIEEAFKYVKQGDLQVLENLNKYVTLKEWDVYHALVNCIDGKGRTLMALAVDKGHSVIIQKLMAYRLQDPEN